MFCLGLIWFWDLAGTGNHLKLRQPSAHLPPMNSQRWKSPQVSVEQPRSICPSVIVSEQYDSRDIRSGAGSCDRRISTGTQGVAALRL